MKCQPTDIFSSKLPILVKKFSCLTSIFGYQVLDIDQTLTGAVSILGKDNIRAKKGEGGEQEPGICLHDENLGDIDYFKSINLYKSDDKKIELVYQVCLTS